jgi:DNA-binding IclR family transcriptional regulator
VVEIHAPMTKKPKSDYAIQTVSNALRLLEMFDEQERLGVTELSRRLDLHKNNVFRLLATLEQAGYIEQCAEDDQYRLGLRCLELGQHYSRSRSLLCRARPVLAALARELGETAHLGIDQDDEVAHLASELPDRMLVTARREGLRLPLHCTALGKVLLAFAEDGRRAAFDRDRASVGLAARTPATLVDRDKLFEQLRTAAGLGFALDVEECEIGLVCAAAPVLDRSGRAVAAISVSAPTARVDEDELHRRVAPAVQAAALDLSRQLGFSG